MLHLTHPEILRAERFGSRDRVEICRCFYCNLAIDEDTEYVLDVACRRFCSDFCKDKYYGAERCG